MSLPANASKILFSPPNERVSDSCVNLVISSGIIVVPSNSSIISTLVERVYQFLKIILSRRLSNITSSSLIATTKSLPTCSIKTSSIIMPSPSLSLSTPAVSTTVS